MGPPRPQHEEKGQDCRRDRDRGRGDLADAAGKRDGLREEGLPGDRPVTGLS
jgi:hypothetical protein